MLETGAGCPIAVVRRGAEPTRHASALVNAEGGGSQDAQIASLRIEVPVDPRVVVSLAPLCLPQATAQNPYSSALSPSVVATSAFAGGCPDTKCVSQSSNTCSPQVGTVCHVIEVHKCRTIRLLDSR